MDETCQNCGETNAIECACLRNKCIICGRAVGNITFTRCDAHWETKNIPECCGGPVEIFECNGRGKGDWVAHCKHCWDGTTAQPTKEAAVEAWYEECT